MAKMLELSHKDFKAVMIKMLHETNRIGRASFTDLVIKKRRK